MQVSLRQHLLVLLLAKPDFTYTTIRLHINYHWGPKGYLSGTLSRGLIRDLIRIRGGLIQNSAGMSQTVRDILYLALSGEVGQAFIHSSFRLSGAYPGLIQIFVDGFCSMQYSS